jgi:hypothetical protein
VIRSAVEEVRSHRTAKRRNWFDISSGIVILLEAASRYKTYKGFQPAHLLALAGVLTILKGVFADKFPRRRRIVLSDKGIFARRSPFISFSLEWTEIKSIHSTPLALSFLLKVGKKVLHLKRVENRSEVIDKTLDAARVRGIEIVE